MNPAFKMGDTVYWSGRPFTVVSPPSLSVHGYIYSIAEHGSLKMHDVFEINLESRDAWIATHMGSQNSIGRAAFEHKYHKGFEIKLKEKSCVCGAHKVKDSAHSSWCDIKN